MVTVGVDQSFSCTGVVVSMDGEMVHHERIFCDGKNTTPLDTVFRAQKIADSLLAIVDLYGADRVVLEGLSFGSVTNATRDLAMLQALIIDRMMGRGVSIQVVAPTTLKKFATGKGTAKKDQMFECLPESVKNLFSGVPKTKGRFDLTDAYFLSTYGVDVETS